MAQDMQWPSEDEDFDAVAAPANKRPKTSSRPAVAASSNPVKTVSVAVGEPETDTEPLPDLASESAELTESSPETAPEVDPVEAAFAEPEPPQETETPVEPEQPAAPDTPSVSEPEAEPYVAPAVVPPTSSRTSKSLGSSSKLWYGILAATLVLALVAAGALFASNSSKDKKIKDLNAQVNSLNANPQIAIQKQTDKLIADVGALMTLPKGETPTVANVSDAAKAKEQSNFFANAQNGDKVLMYVKAGQAILYRPSTNKIILVAPLTFNNSTAATSSSATTTTPKTSR